MYGILMIDIDSSALTTEDISLIKQAQVGGVILFARNVVSPRQVRHLCDDIRHYNPDVIIGVDQEGGRVARLREGFTKLPAMGKLGQLFDQDATQALRCAYDCGYLMATEVLAVGIDVSFAPVLDCDGISQVIGDRSFHSDPKVIIDLASQFMHGMKAAGMATTGKHFPGHGSVAPDSHISDAVDTRSLDEILATDMQPFSKTLPWLNALMPAHVVFSQVDTKPAGFSKIWLKDILRHQLQFEGVLFSDDLSMKAAHVAGNISARVQMAIEAGCDMVLVCNDRIAAHEAAEAAQTLPYPNQRRIKTMRGQIPLWQGTLESTCEQFEHWYDAKQNISRTFFSAATEAACPDSYSNTATLSQDPTEYK